jgi:hypothetical protein
MTYYYRNVDNKQHPTGRLRSQWEQHFREDVTEKNRKMGWVGRATTVAQKH